MKNIKKISALGLAGVLVFGAFAIYGCGQSSADTMEGSAESAAAVETDEPATADTFAVNGRDGAASVSVGTEENGEYIMHAMVLRDPGSNLYFVDVDNGSFFTAAMPESIKDVNGNAITEDDLSAGDLVDITGNGIMLDSYPGQYPGVTDITVTSEGSKEDAQQYQHLIDEIYIGIDPSQPPFMNVEYRTELAVTTLILETGNYEWAYTDENGEEQIVVACGNHDELNEANLDDATDLSLLPSKEMESVEITRWTDAQWEVAKGSTDAADISEGETVEAVLEDGVWVIKNAEPGYVYLITAHWAEGYVEYGFRTV